MTLAGLLVLAALDSINPSAIVVTLYLLSRPEASVQVAVYIVLMLGHLFFEHRLRERYAELRLRLQRGAHETALWIAGLVGGGLFVTSAIELVARLRYL